MSGSPWAPVKHVADYDEELEGEDSESSIADHEEQSKSSSDTVEVLEPMEIDASGPKAMPPSPEGSPITGAESN